MLKKGADVFFQEPSSKTRLLRRSTVIETGSDSFTVEFAEESIPLEAGQELLCYFDGGREFMQQLIRVEEVVTGGPQLVAELVAVGDPISAESRQTYRVSTISADIRAEVGDERDLSVQDVSITGFAVIAKGPYSIGTTFPVSIAFESASYRGVASIQSVRELRPGRVRYGLRALKDHPEAGDLVDGLRHVSLAVQRTQLKRTSGIG